LDSWLSAFTFCANVVWNEPPQRLHPNRIVADRFHVIRLVNHHFLTCWRDLDGVRRLQAK